MGLHKFVSLVNHGSDYSHRGITFSMTIRMSDESLSGLKPAAEERAHELRTAPPWMECVRGELTGVGGRVWSGTSGIGC
jgi:hypothetical protein